MYKRSDGPRADADGSTLNRLHNRAPTSLAFPDRHGLAGSGREAQRTGLLALPSATDGGTNPLHTPIRAARLHRRRLAVGIVCQRVLLRVPKGCCTAMQALWAQAVARGAKRVASSGARPISAACLHALPLAHGHRGGPSRRRLAPAALPVSTCCRQAAATICLRVHAICPCRHRRRAHARAMVRRGACTTEKRRTKKRGADFWRSGRVGGRGRLCEAVDGRAGNGICILLPFLDFVHASFERRLSVCLLASVHTRAYALRAGT